MGFPRSPRLADLRDSLVRASTSSERSENSDATTWHWGTWEENWMQIMRPLVGHMGST